MKDRPGLQRLGMTVHSVLASELVRHQTSILRCGLQVQDDRVDESGVMQRKPAVGEASDCFGLPSGEARLAADFLDNREAP